ncbi:alpha-amylase [Streptococcus porcinus]|uniref:Alpha-amylase n=1 Tax=Streptococcus porcinus TaxID=1340 RepID=A0A7W0ARL5_STRPO|nr:alpha-amylase [Streptococcus porcinus]MBA2795379.1 alpha-amylase [Streptococcus porcinus]
MTNELLFQAFEWYLPDDHHHWKNLHASIPDMQKLGITKMWLPPAFKGTGSNDVGYGIYDLFDLGEFDQNGTIPTKYGTKEEYLDLINSLNDVGIMPIADIVLNHKANGDQKETFYVLKMDPENRQQPISDPYEIEGWTGFNFLGRNDKYNNFKWHWYHFTGIDYDARNNETGIYMITGDNKGWANQEVVNNEKGNFDYLMFCDIDFKHPEVQDHLREWAHWFIETTGVSGFRLDAIKHIDATFMNHFIRYVRENIAPDLFIFGEYWKNNAHETDRYLKEVDMQIELVDVALHMNFFEASKGGNQYNMATLLDNTLMQVNSKFAITFVDNHDTQSGQALESQVEDWFKPLAYGLIMLRQEGTPCLFYGDYYGVQGEHGQVAFKDLIDKMAWLRKKLVYGKQVDYFDHANCIGWTELGNDETNACLAVVMTNGDRGWKHMEVGKLYAGQTFIDYLGHCSEEIIIDEDGWADFIVEPGSIAAWIPKNTMI